MLGWNGPHGPCPRGYGREAKSSGRGGRRGSVRRGRPRPPPRGAMVTAASFGERRLCPAPYPAEVSEHLGCSGGSLAASVPG